MIRDLFTVDNFLLLGVIAGLALVFVSAKPKYPRTLKSPTAERMRLWNLADGSRKLQASFGLFDPVAATYTERDYE